MSARVPKSYVDRLVSLLLGGRDCNGARVFEDSNGTMWTVSIKLAKTQYLRSPSRTADSK